MMTSINKCVKREKMFRHRLLRVVLRTTSTTTPASNVVTLSSTGARVAKTTATLLTGVCVVYCTQTTAECAAEIPSQPSSSGEGKSSSPFGSGDNNDPIKKLLKQHMPTIKSLGLSGGMGICCAVALKRVSIQAAYVVGLGFTALQVLSYLGYIQIDYSKVSKDAASVLDVNRDGEVNEEDLMAVYDKSKDVLTKNLQDVTGFLSGFALGIYLI